MSDAEGSRIPGEDKRPKPRASLEASEKAGSAAPPSGTAAPEKEAPPPEPAGDADSDLASMGEAISIRGNTYAGDGRVEIRVAEDWMTAWATFSPPADNGRPITREMVAELLLRVGVTEGVLWDDIAEAMLECNLERHYLRDRIVAEGLLPEEEVPEHAAIEERFARKSQMASAEAIKVDFRELSSLPVVKKDEVLARLIPKSEGRLGKDIRGKELVAPRRSVENWLAGKNVAAGEGGLRAIVDGLLVKSERTLSVEEIFLVKGGVDFHTGHIVFPGDVVIEGRVGDGFKVWSGANIVCKTTLDAFDVNAKKDLFCQQGIIGRRRGQVRVGGQLGAKFIENCRVAARGDIHVTSAIMGSRVYTLGLVDLGDKGVIMGGETWAVHGVKAARLGNQAKQRTVIHVGIDFTVQQRLDQANERLRVITLRSQQIDGFAASHPDIEPGRLHHEAARSLEETQNLIMKLLGSLDADDGAVVEVKGEIFPGTVIDICRVEISVDQLLKACRFRLDKAAGRIVIEHLTGKPAESAGKQAPHGPGQGSGGSKGTGEEGRAESGTKETPGPRKR
jgi:hypothetical protein